MINQERLALQGAAAALNKDINRLRLQVKGHGANIRGLISIYALQHIEEININDCEMCFALFLDSLKELRQRQAELQEIEAGL